MLRIEQLTKKFGSNTAVDAATIEVDRPMMIGIIGRSGAGKSTLLRMLNRLTDHTSGSVTFEGRDVTALRGSDKPSGLTDFLLTIVTCGIYGIFVAYKYPKYLVEIQQKHGKPANDISTISLILALFGLQIVAWALIQNEINVIVGDD